MGGAVHLEGESDEIFRCVDRDIRGGEGLIARGVLLRVKCHIVARGGGLIVEEQGLWIEALRDQNSRSVCELCGACGSLCGARAGADAVVNEQDATVHQRVCKRHIFDLPFARTRRGDSGKRIHIVLGRSERRRRVLVLSSEVRGLVDLEPDR